MILADKILLHRKYMNLTQEELADKMNVSRQSVSKWESAQSIPDMDKIILLSDIFEVSIDYFLRDEIDTPEYIKSSNAKRKINLEFANQFINDSYTQSKLVSMAVLLSIYSPIFLVFFNLLIRNNIFIASKDFLTGVGLIIMILMITGAIGLFIKNDMKMHQYKFFEYETFETEYGVEGIISQKYEIYKETFSKKIILGVTLLFLSLIPIFISILVFPTPLMKSIGLPASLLFVGFGMMIIANTNIRNNAYKKLLQIDDYTETKKKENDIFGSFAGIYWALMATIYFAISFIFDAWVHSWIVWPVAGVLFGLFSMVVLMFIKVKNN